MPLHGIDEWLVMAGLGTAGLLLLALGIPAWVRARRRRARELAIYPRPGSGTDADVGRLLDAGEKTLAVRLYRELYRVDLKSAREAVEELAGPPRRGV